MKNSLCLILFLRRIFGPIIVLNQICESLLLQYFEEKAYKIVNSVLTIFPAAYFEFFSQK